MKKLKAFTMAEILLSLTIIGVVAAITLPSLTGNINERTWNTQRKALYARFSQALALMPNLNSYGTLYAEGVDASGSSYDAVDNAAETFVTSGLATVMKINNICDSEHLEDCGIPTTVTTLTGSVLNSFTTSYSTLFAFNTLFSSSNTDVYATLDTKAAAFETANGESILVYYNPNCIPDMQESGEHYIQKKMCANFVYDLNGSKGPNTVGKDIGFISALYPSDPVVAAPMPLTSIASSGATLSDAGELCKNQDSESRLPNRYELASMFFNRTLLGTSYSNNIFWSSSIYSGDSTKAWPVNFQYGIVVPREKTTSYYVRCVKR